MTKEDFRDLTTMTHTTVAAWMRNGKCESTPEEIGKAALEATRACAAFLGLQPTPQEIQGIALGVELSYTEGEEIG